MLLFVISNTRCQEFFSNIFFRKPESFVLEGYLGICTLSKNHTVLMLIAIKMYQKLPTKNSGNSLLLVIPQAAHGTLYRRICLKAAHMMNTYRNLRTEPFVPTYHIAFGRQLSSHSLLFSAKPVCLQYSIFCTVPGRTANLELSTSKLGYTYMYITQTCTLFHIRTTCCRQTEKKHSKVRKNQ